MQYLQYYIRPHITFSFTQFHCCTSISKAFTEESEGDEPLLYKPALDLQRFREFIENEQQRVQTEEEQQRARLTQSIADKKLMDMMNMKPG